MKLLNGGFYVMDVKLGQWHREIKTISNGDVDVKEITINERNGTKVKQESSWRNTLEREEIWRIIVLKIKFVAHLFFIIFFLNSVFEEILIERWHRGRPIITSVTQKKRWAARPANTQTDTRGYSDKWLPPEQKLEWNLLKIS